MAEENDNFPNWQFEDTMMQFASSVSASDPLQVNFSPSVSHSSSTLLSQLNFAPSVPHSSNSLSPVPTLSYPNGISPQLNFLPSVPSRTPTPQQINHYSPYQQLNLYSNISTINDMEHYNASSPTLNMNSIDHYNVSSSTTMRQNLSKAKRSEHNSNERKRRENFNVKFQELAKLLPNLQNDIKASRNVIIDHAISYIQSAIARNERSEKRINDLEKYIDHMLSQSKEQQNYKSEKVASPICSSPLPIDNTKSELESFEDENALVEDDDEATDDEYIIVEPKPKKKETRKNKYASQQQIKSQSSNMLPLNNLYNINSLPQQQSNFHNHNDLYSVSQLTAELPNSADMDTISEEFDNETSDTLSRKILTQVQLQQNSFTSQQQHFTHYYDPSLYMHRQ